MFSFFRKKPVESESPSEPWADRKDGKTEGPSTAPASALASSSGRPRTAAEWLNADVGELFFGKKPGRASATEIKDESVAADGIAPVPTPGSLPPAEQEDDRRDWLARLRTGLRRTGSHIAEVFVGATIDAAMYEDLEAALLQADAGAAATRFLLDDLRGRVTRADVRDPKMVRRLLADSVADLLAPLEKPLVIGEHVPTVIMVVGVNGAGKTTSVGKLARYLMDANQKVLLAAADTFRAAAREQLLAWAERADPGMAEKAAAGATVPSNRLEIVSQEGGDPAGLTFDAVVAAKARHCDVVIADTAGRLATQSHLMEELKKIRRTIGKAQAGAPHEVLLVIDGNTGQNALTQVQAFDTALGLTGLVITKLDGTAKGGVLADADEVHR